MKSKLLIFLGLAVASLGLAITLNAPDAHAAGEKYVWTSATTLQASGGKYRGTTTYTVTTERRVSGSTMELTTNDVNIDAMYGDCDHAPGRLSFNNNSRTDAMLWMGDLATGTQTSCGTYPAGEQGMDMNVKVTAQAAPDVNYNTVNCEQTTRTADGLAQCKAIKACVVDASKPQDQCISAMSTCITNHTINGGITDAALEDCRKKVTAGDIGGATAPVTGEEEEQKTSCAVVGVGWIVCPITTFLAQIVDAAYGFVASLLVVQPLVVTGGSGGAQGSQGVYTAWTVMRNFANISFVIAFLIIIFSQLTSIGITNYGIKKMLPKLIVSAVLVNLSFWLCAAAVDISNIAGSSINDILKGVKDGAVAVPNVNLGADSTGAGWSGIVGAVLAGGAAIGIAFYVGLSALLPALITVVMTIVVVFLVLTLRQALIILLIVVSPLAFVAYLLPNTQNLFNKWKDLFQVLLVMYPLISLVFGASALASTIVMTSASGDYKIAIQIMGAAISILPLIIVPTLIKTTQGVLGRFGAFVDNPNKGPVSALQKKADNYRGYRDNTRKGNALSGNARVFGGGKYKRAYRRELRDQAADSAAKSGQAQFGVTDAKAAASVASNLQSQAQINAINAANSTRFVGSVATNPDLVRDGMGKAKNDGEVDKALVAQQQKAVADAIREVELSADFKPGDLKSIGAEMARAVSAGDSITARAMQNMLLKSGSAGTAQYRETMEKDVSSADMGSKTMDDMKHNFLQNHAGVKESAYDLMKHAVSGSGTTMSAVSNDAKVWEGLSNEDLVGQKSHSLDKAYKAGGISKAKAQAIKGDQQLYRKLDAEGQKIIDAAAV